MASNSEALLRQAQLAQLVYSDELLSGMNAAELRRAAERSGLVVKSDPFFENLTLLSISDPTPSGFSAAIFKDTRTGEVYFANRGTDSLIDGLHADVLGIAILGAAGSQIVDMYRYFRRCTTAVGEQVQYSFGERALLESIATACGIPGRTQVDLTLDVGTGALMGPDGIPEMTVTGHSLGGHLAQWFAALFPEHVTSASTFNGAGIGSGFMALQSAVSQLLIGRQISVDASLMTHVYAEPGIELTARAGSYPGLSIPTFIEDNGHLDNHRIGHLVDALAVLRVLNVIDPDLSIESASGILSAVQQRPDASLEHMLNAVGRIVFANWTEVPAGNREALYAGTERIRQQFEGLPGPVTHNYSILSLTQVDPDDIAAAAAGGAFASGALAWRYALHELNPFVLLVNGADGSIDVTLTNAAYEPFAAQLALYDARTGEGAITDQWLADRAAVLAARNDSFAQDRQFLESSDGVIRRYDVRTPDGVEQVQYLPAALLRGREFFDFAPFAEHDIQFGSAAGEELRGSSGTSHLHGGAGNDILEGGRGEDRLEGGTGFDTYRIVAGEGHDVIHDVDGLGMLQFTRADGAIDGLSGGAQIAAGVWESQDGRYRYYHAANPETGAGDLEITAGADLITVRHYRRGQLGIDLPGRAPEAVERTVLAGTAGDDRGSEALRGTAAAEEIRGLAGDDDLHGKGGADLFHGGAGSDLMVWVDEGTAARQRMFGEDGNDIAVLGGTLGSELDGGAGRDFLSAGNSDDLLSGGDGDDGIFGAGGKDVLLGGAGNDVLAGDGTYVTFNRDWQHAFEDRGHFRDYHPTLSVGAGSTFSTADGADHLDGGAGNDYVFGGGGNDVLIGGAETLGADEDDDDELIGGAGDDRLVGGAANDRLFGDLPYPDGNPAGADSLDGGAGQDLLIGGGGADRLLGGADDDELFGDFAEPNAAGGDDALDGGVGNDRLQAGAGEDRLSGGAGDDVLFGDDGEDFLDGGEGADQLAGGAGADRLIGGTGADQLFGEAEADSLDGGAGDDTLAGGEGDDILSGSSGDDLLFGEAANDALYGDDGNDRLQGGDGVDSLAGGAGHDVLAGGAGADALDGDDGDDELQGGDDDDVLRGAAGADRLFGDAGSDDLNGGSGADQLQGGAGADVLAGGAGDDRLEGSEGDDTYRYSPGDGADRIVETGTSKADRLDLGAFAAADVQLARRGSHLVLLAQAAGLPDGTQSVTLENWYGASAGVDSIVLSDETWSRDYLQAFDVRIGAGTAGDDFVGPPGSDGDDTLYGFAGNDRLSAGAGANVLIGGQGDDELYGSFGSNYFLIGPGDGSDLVVNAGFGYSVVGFGAGVSSGDARFERVDKDLRIETPGSVTLVEGFYAGQVLDAVEFADGTRLDGAALSAAGTTSSREHRHIRGTEQVLQDWGGQDTLSFDLGVEAAEVSLTREGVDLVATTVTAPGDRVVVEDWFEGHERQIEQLRFADGATLLSQEITAGLLNPSGSGTDDHLVSGGFAETLRGLGGDDRLESRGAGDALLGGAGNDVLLGDSSAQTYVFERGDGSDEIIDAGGSDTLVLPTGRAETSFSQVGADMIVAFAGSSDRITIRNGYSSGSIETIVLTETGTPGDDVMRGSSFGPEILRGLGGNDQLSGGDNDVNDAFYQMADVLEGGEGNDVLDGGWGGDHLLGGSGDDIVGGAVDTADFLGAGNRYSGGTGNDTLRGSRSNDTYLYSLGDGRDQIIDPVRPGDTSGLLDRDTLRLAGIAPGDITVTRAGSDLMLDFIDGGQLAVRNWFADGNAQIESVEFESSPGTRWWRQDLHRAALAIRGTAGADTLQGTASGETLYGMAGNDVLLAYGGEDVLDGGAGDDRLVGGPGADIYLFGAGGGSDLIEETAAGDADRLRFGADVTASAVSIGRDGNSIVLATGSDRVTIVNAIADPNARIESVEFADGSALPAMDALVEQLVARNGTAGNDVLEGTSGIDRLHGLAGADELRGLGDSDLLEGGEGDDVLVGGGGDDALRGGDGADRYVFEAGSGIDRIDDALGTSLLQFSATQSALILGAQWTGTAHALRVTAGTGSEVHLEQGLGLNPRILAAGAPELALIDLLAQRHATGTLLEHAGSSLADTIAGTGFHDRIDGAAGHDLLLGFGGSDILYGGVGDDLLAGGAGDDTLQGGAGADVYLFAPGEGKDLVMETFADAASGASVLRLAPGFGMADVQVLKTGKNLVLAAEAIPGSLTVQGYVSGKSTLSVSLGSGDGLGLSAAAVASQAVKSGTAGNDSLRGGSASERLYGGAGNDTLLGKGGDDWLGGGTGNDILDGGAGSDVYLFAGSHGHDVVREGAGSAGEIDTIQFGHGMSLLDLQYRRMAGDLVVSDVSGVQSVTIEGWYTATSAPVEKLRDVTGYEILSSQVEQLVQATAAFGSPAAAGLQRPLIQPDPYESLLVIPPSA